MHLFSLPPLQFSILTISASLVGLQISNVNAASIPSDTHHQLNIRSKTCSISGTSAIVNCRGGPSRSYPTIRSVQPNQSFSVQCMVDGEGIDGEKYVLWGLLLCY